MNKQLRFSDAIEGHELSFLARHKSKNTLIDYHNAYRKFSVFYPSNPFMDEITEEMVEEFLKSLTVDPKTVKNHHIALSALWTWAVGKGYLVDNIIRRIKPPDPAKSAIRPLEESEVKLMLSVVNKSKPYRQKGTLCSHNQRDADRNRAIMLTLLDTGMRASEICSLLIRHVNLKNTSKTIFIHDGKGEKDRYVPISATTAQAIWKYLISRPNAMLDDPLFITEKKKAINRFNLDKMLSRIAARAGVVSANPHKWRHTFAINYLRNGGDVYTLKAILGHEELETCLHYLQLAQTDIDKGHRLASPVDHWQL